MTENSLVFSFLFFFSRSLSFSSLFFLLSPILHSGHGCMPGFESERATLQEYLGIEWVENGLENNAHSMTRTIRHASDLNCDFANASNCRWSNVGDKFGLDTVDFYLFEKTDFTEFPAIRVRPGPSKVSEGDKMILAGQKKKDEQSAVWFSSPIRCQNSTGVLTFTFWLFNGARVEVLMLESFANGTLVALAEKPFVDCTTVPMNTDCRAEIPPRDKPFHLAIRAYNMVNAEGSFVMLDNLIYDASLCRVAVDLGDDFQTIPLITGAHGETVDRVEQFLCTDFDDSCRWRSGRDDRLQWKKAIKSPDSSLLFQATGTARQPDGPFATLYVEQDTKAPWPPLLSDPVPCVAERVCVLELVMLEELECHVVPSAQSPGPVHIVFEPRKSSFMMSIQVESLDVDGDNFVAIDDLSLTAIFCSDAVHVLDLGPDFHLTPMLSVILNRPLASDQDLACDFERRAVDCNWANSDVVEGAVWEIGQGPLSETKFHTLTRTHSVPDDSFAVVRFDGPGKAANLVTELLKCVDGGATLHFKHWITGQAKLSVCLLEEDMQAATDCQLVDVDEVEIVVELPPVERPFRLAIRAHSESRGLAMIDDLRLQGRVCASVLSRTHGTRILGSAQKSASLASPDANVCRLLSCDFDQHHMCLYNSQRIPGSVSTFGLVEQRPLGAGSLSRGTFLRAHLFRRGSIAILESPLFRLNSFARLHFDFRRQGGNATLFVCQDSAKRELDACFRVNGESSNDEWRHDFMELLPSDTKFYVIAKTGDQGQMSRVYLDNIRLTDLEDNAVC